MPGFNIAIGNLKFHKNLNNNRRYFDLEKITNNNYTINKIFLNKFTDDKIFTQNNECVLILDGVILNKKELNKNNLSWSESVIELYRQNGDTFFRKFRGCFSGAIYDKYEDKWIVFTDHLASKHVYYTEYNDGLYVSSDLIDLFNFYKINNLNYSIDQQAAYMLLSYGYMLDDHTLCKEIRKINHGSYIEYKNKQISIKSYYDLDIDYDYSITEDDALKNIDDIFGDSIKLQFEKDRQYGYKHLVGLSGGLDSRMTSWVAHSKGYTEQLNYTFSQSGYLDETIAKNIASDLKHEWIFKFLDNGLFLKDIDEINNISGGQAIYYGLAHGNSVLKYLNFRNLGILHTGQLGDVIIGSYIKRKKNEYNYKGNGAYSKRLLSKTGINIEISNANDLETFLMLQRGFNGINTGLLPAQNYTETMSPFYNVDFLNYCMKLPLEMRINHNLYRKWIMKYYPEAAKYVWESRNALITMPTVNILGKEEPINQLFPKLLRKLKLLPQKSNTKNHMNPLAYWYKTNSDIRNYQDNYYKENIDRFNLSNELKKDAKNLYETGSNIEKIQVLTLLSAIKILLVPEDS